MNAMKAITELVLVTNADSAIGRETMRPPAIQLNVGLLHLAMAEQQPESEDGYKQEVEDGIDDDLGIDRWPVRAPEYAPDTKE